MDLEEELTAVLAAFPELSVTQTTPLGLAFNQQYLITINMPQTYPNELPEVTLRVPWLSSEHEKAIASAAVAACAPGEPMLFTIICEIQNAMPPAPSLPAQSTTTVGLHPLLITSDKELAFGAPPVKPYTAAPIREPPPEESKDLFPLTFISGSTISDRKSSFQAHLAKIESPKDVESLLELLKAHRKVGKATHNIWAYVTSFGEEDFGDDGEAGAGQKLVQVVHQSGARDVLVVVSRWFGGIHLGQDRFKHIMKVAWELLRAQGYCQGRGKH